MAELRLITWQNYGREMLDRTSRVGISQFVRRIPIDYGPVKILDVIVGNQEANQRLQILAQSFGINLEHAMQLLRRRA